MSCGECGSAVCHCVRTHVRNGRPVPPRAAGVVRSAASVGRCRADMRNRARASGAPVGSIVSRGPREPRPLRRRRMRCAVTHERRGMTDARKVPRGECGGVQDHDNCSTHARVGGAAWGVGAVHSRRPVRRGVAQRSAHGATAMLDRERSTLPRGAAPGTPDAHGTAVRLSVGRCAGSSLAHAAERRPTAARPNDEGRTVWNG